MGRSPLIIRADAGAQMGTGHVMRCLALAQGWQDQGGGAVFVMSQAPQALESRLLAEGMEMARLAAPPGSAEDARETAALARERGGEWLVVDGYQFGADYQHLVKEAGLALLFIDDYGHAGHYWADLVLNQNLTAHEDFYSQREQYTRLLLGTRYVLMRREFWPWQGWRREIPEVARKVLVTLGGGDPDNVTLKVISALMQVEIEGLEVVVVVGGANPHLEELQAAVKNLPHLIRFEHNANNMPDLMAWAEIALTGAGSTCWEMAFMGLPAMTIVLADNQIPVAENLASTGVVVNLGWHEDLWEAKLTLAVTKLIASKKIRALQANRGRALVDGGGVSRIVKICG